MGDFIPQTPSLGTRPQPPTSLRAYSLFYLRIVLVYNEQGSLPHEGLDERFCNICADTDMTRLQEIWYDAKTRSCRIAWRPVRPLQADDRWFETAWQKFQSGEAFS